MSNAIVLASSVKRIVPVARYSVIVNGAQYGPTTSNFEAACGYANTLVSVGIAKRVSVEMTRVTEFC